jgi:hypothetical protein
MDRLPQVLQNEIWEYVRGDRAHWKQQHRALINEFFPAFRDEPHDKTIYLSKILASPKAFGVFRGVERDTVIRVQGYRFRVMIFPPEKPQGKFGVTGFLDDDPIEYFDFVEARSKILDHLKRYHNFDPDDE